MKQLVFTLLAAGGVLGLVGALSACSGKAGEKSAERDSTFTTVNHPDWSRNAIIYEVNLRQFTDSGTVTAFAEQLPRLKELGADILWFMPINPISQKDRKGTLGSYYAVADYNKFNPEFGTVEQFKDMVSKAHELGMKVILDWVPNHTGRDNAWVTEHPDWYEKDSLGQMMGIYDWTDVYVLDYNNPEMRRGMLDALKYWVGDVGVDGFRMDVAMEVPTDFWEDTRRELGAIKPDVFLLAEASVPELQKNAFNMAYNWPMKDLFSEIAATQGQYKFVDPQGNMKTFPAKDATAIDSLLAAQAKDYPRDSYMMNMITNHDLNSWEGTEFERLGVLNRAFAVLTYTLPGMPLLYTGQETGMNRAFEFFEKDKAPEWEPRNEFFTFYQTLGNLKHGQAALAAGEEGGPMVRYATSVPGIYAFSRTKGDSQVVTIVNLTAEEQPLQFTGEAPNIEGMTDIFTKAPAALPETMDAGDYLVFTK